MSEQEKRQIQGSQPNPLAFLRFRTHDEKASIIRDLITSDKNNATKARIPTVFGMTAFRMLGAWASPKSKIEYKIGDTKVEALKTVAGMEQFFYDNYNIISMSYKGLSREEYERAASSWLAQQQAVMQGAQQMRMEEGVKKKA